MELPIQLLPIAPDRADFLAVLVVAGALSRLFPRTG